MAEGTTKIVEEVARGGKLVTETGNTREKGDGLTRREAIVGREMRGSGRDISHSITAENKVKKW